MEFEELRDQNFTLLGQNCQLSGEFHLSGMVRVSSEMEGKLVMAPDSKLTIDRQGYFRGEISCHDIEIFGQFVGKLKSSGKVILRSSSSVEGQIESQKLAIYPGAVVNIQGHTKVKETSHKEEP